MDELLIYLPEGWWHLGNARNRQRQYHSINSGLHYLSGGRPFCKKDVDLV